MAVIKFKAKLFKLGEQSILLLPKSASDKLPSRGQTMVVGTINSFNFQYPLEPDGRGSHWLKVDKSMLKNIAADVGDTVTVAIEPSKEWPEPEIPADLAKALANDKAANKLWIDITPMARWDWIRWIRATNNPATRQKHVEVALSKLKHGSRRPCCFNRTICTDMALSKGGMLLESAQAI